MKGIRKGLIIGAILAIALMLSLSSFAVGDVAPEPTLVCADEVEAAPVVVVVPDILDDCCAYSTNSCCWDICCALQTNWYKVSYFDDGGNWISNYVEMPVQEGAEAAAEYFGLTAGYDCFVGCAIGYDPAG